LEARGDPRKLAINDDDKKDDKDKKIAAQPSPTASSLVFFVGTRSSAVQDSFLDHARIWATNIQKAAKGVPSVQISTLGKDLPVIATTIGSFSTTSLSANTPETIQDTQFGELRGHSFVFLTHGLEDSSGNNDSQGLLF